MINRREFAQRAQAKSDVPTRAAKVMKLFESPEGHPNGLEPAKGGFRIGEQTSDRAHLVNGRDNGNPSAGYICRSDLS